MTSKPITTRIWLSLLVWGLAAIVVGMPLLSLAANGSPATFVSTENEEKSDGESDGVDWELLEVFALPGDDCVPELSVVGYHGTDDLAETCSELSNPHLERGPPAC